MLAIIIIPRSVVKRGSWWSTHLLISGAPPGTNTRLPLLGWNAQTCMNSPNPPLALCVVFLSPLGLLVSPSHRHGPEAQRGKRAWGHTTRREVVGLRREPRASRMARLGSCRCLSTSSHRGSPLHSHQCPCGPLTGHFVQAHSNMHTSQCTYHWPSNLWPRNSRMKPKGALGVVVSHSSSCLSIVLLIHSKVQTNRQTKNRPVCMVGYHLWGKPEYLCISLCNVHVHAHTFLTVLNACLGRRTWKWLLTAAGRQGLGGKLYF